MPAANRILLTCCLAILLLAVGSPTIAKRGYYTDNLPAEHLYSMGCKLGEMGRYQDAINKYKAAIKLEPSFVAAYINASQCSNQLGEYQNAIAYASNALKYNSTTDYAFSNRAKAYQNLLQYDKAVADWNQAIKNDPSISYYYINRGICLQRLLKNKEAGADFAKALNMPVKDEDDYQNRGSVYLELKDFKNANSAFALALRANPKLVTVRHDQGLCQVGLGQYQAAINNYSQCLKEDPTYYHCYYLRGVAQMMDGNYQQASQDLRKFLQSMDWKGSHVPYALMICCVADRQLKHDAAATALLKESKSKLQWNGWPAPVIKYLSGETTASSVLDAANNSDLMTEAKTYLGVNLAATGKKPQAQEYLTWVTKNGNKGFSEYQIATAELRRLAPTASPAGVKH